jgi:hypothetical protein
MTTAMRAIFGLTNLDAGTVRWNGVVRPSGTASSTCLRNGGSWPGLHVDEQLELGFAKLPTGIYRRAILCTGRAVKLREVVTRGAR